METQQIAPHQALRDNSRFTTMHFILVCCFSFRPDFYPPSYEDSTDPEKQTFPLPVASAPKEQEVINIPPPPYSESSTEPVSETNEPEQPPPYELPGQVLSPMQESDACAPSQDNACWQQTGRQGTSDRARDSRAGTSVSAAWACITQVRATREKHCLFSYLREAGGGKQKGAQHFKTGDSQVCSVCLRKCHPMWSQCFFTWK